MYEELPCNRIRLFSSTKYSKTGCVGVGRYTEGKSFDSCLSTSMKNRNCHVVRDVTFHIHPSVEQMCFTNNFIRRVRSSSWRVQWQVFSPPSRALSGIESLAVDEKHRYHRHQILSASTELLVSQSVKCVIACVLHKWQARSACGSPKHCRTNGEQHRTSI